MTSNNRAPSNRVYGYDQKPAKIDLIRELPRRDSQLEEQLNKMLIAQHKEQQQWKFIPFRSQQQQPNQQQSSSSRQQQQQQLEQHASSSSSSGIQQQQYPQPPPRNPQNIQTNPISTIKVDYGLPELDNITNELAKKEAKLRREMAYMNTYKNQFVPKSSWDVRKEPQSLNRNRVWHKEVPISPRSSRPNSQASSIRSATTEADVLEKAAKLLEDAEEMERKQIIEEPIVLDPKGNPKPAGSPGGTLNRRGVKAAIISVPNREIDNKSPLPFAYDNFSTIGVRGNIASVGAAEPEKPYPPIFPQIKRAESPLIK